MAWGDELGVRVVGDHAAVLFLGVESLRVVAVGLVHLAEVDVADAHLGLGGLGSVGEEDAEVAVLALGLGERGGAAFLVPAIRDGELGAHLVLRIGIGVEHGLEVEAADVEVALLDGDLGLVEELLVGQLGVGADESVGHAGTFLMAFFLVSLDGDDLVVLLLLAASEGVRGARRTGSACRWRGRRWCWWWSWSGRRGWSAWWGPGVGTVGCWA